ncbi:hypothetical protein ACWEWX_04760 [Streptomyces asiaticus]
MTTTTTPSFTPTANDMEAVHNGILVTSYGEDGNMLAIGHHDPHQVLDAFNHLAHAYGLDNVADDPNANMDDWRDAIRHGWLTFHRGEPNSDLVWEGKPATEDTPGAVAVTLLDVA